MKDVFKEVTPSAIDKLGFGIYHFGQGGKDAFGFQDNNVFPYHGYDREQCNYQESLGYMNFYSYRLDEASYMHLRRMRELDAVSWVYYLPIEQMEKNGKKIGMLRAGWKDEITAMVEGVKKAGLWDCIAGFHYDEPLLYCDGETFEEFSQFISTFGKRQYAVFSLYEIQEGLHPTFSSPEYGKTAHLINPSNTRYLTDIGLDVYGRTDIDYYRKYNEMMLNDIQRDNLYVWGFPTTWKGRPKPGETGYTEDLCIENLEMHRKLLDEQRYPGGLFCYTWRSWKLPDESLDFHFDTNNPNRWNRLEAKMIEIGKELGSTKLKPIE